MYGGWIDPKGKVIDVEEKCMHTRVCDYSDGDDEGWIAFTNSSAVYNLQKGIHYGMSLRFNPKTVTKRAIKTCLRLIGKSDQDEIHISNMWLDKIKGTSTQGLTRKEAQEILRRYL